MSGLSCEIFFSNIYARWISWNHHEFHDEHFSFISPPVISWILESEKRKSLVTSHLIRKRTALQNQEKVYGFSQAFENFSSSYHAVSYHFLDFSKLFVYQKYLKLHDRIDRRTVRFGPVVRMVFREWHWPHDLGIFD